MARKARKKKAVKKGSKKPAIKTAALEISKGDQTVVGILNLRVAIVQDGRFWFAQGLDIDYGAQGSSLDDVTEQFESGLVATIHRRHSEHLKIYGTIENVLQVAPPTVWKLRRRASPAGLNNESAALTTPPPAAGRCRRTIPALAGSRASAARSGDSSGGSSATFNPCAVNTAVIS